MKIYEKLKSARLKKGLSLRAMAAAVGTDHKGLANMEAGTNVKWHMLRDAALFLGYEINLKKKKPTAQEP